MARLTCAVLALALGAACARDPAPPEEPTVGADADWMIFEGSVADQRELTVYGGATHAEVVEDERGTALAIALDRAEFSGATISLPRGTVLDLSGSRATGGLAFYIRGAAGGEPIFVGLLDDQGDEIHTEVRFPLAQWQPVKQEWTPVDMPLRLFGDRGERWDSTLGQTVPSEFRWDRVQRVRFSAPRAVQVNQAGVDEIKVADVFFEPDRPVEDAFARWERFQSTAPDVVLHDFNAPETWARAAGPGSRVIDVGFDDPPGSMQVSFEVPTWAEVSYPYPPGDPRRDWSHHWGLALDLSSSDMLWTYRVALIDGSGERWEAIASVEEGEHTVIVRFRDFHRATEGHAEDVVYNERLDLDAVRSLHIGPYMFTGYLRVGEIRLTNQRDASQRATAPLVPTTVYGDWREPLNPDIDPGAFGINAAVWDGDLLSDDTVERVKRVGHGLVRYPGGLVADDHHWEAELEAADPLRVDTDEFLTWCDAVGARPLFTANAGSGTAEEAARWVAYTRGRVHSWEIGNEVYGSWHPHRASAADYAQRVRDYITAMKAVDPTIEVGAVWDIEDPAWSREVFARVGELPDAVVVHAYAQSPGSEDDQILLAAPTTLGNLLHGLRGEIAKHPRRRSPPKLWFTEWSSVPDTPSAQTLGVAHALYVADTLGALVQGQVPVAAYWDIHNGLTPRGGDYGYLSRSFDPEGLNVQRPTWHAFRMATDALNGALYPSHADHKMVSTYLTRTTDGRSALMLINRSAEQGYGARLEVPGLVGDATVEVLDASTGPEGPTPAPLRLEADAVVVLPPRTLTLVVQAAAPSARRASPARDQGEADHGG